MDSSRHFDWERLDRWVRKDGTAEELEILRRWVESAPELTALAEAMRTIGQSADREARSWDTQGRWQQLRRQMRRADRPLRLTDSRGALELRRRKRWPAAAAAAMALLAIGGWWVVGAPGVARDHAIHAVPTHEIVTRRGERAMVDLPDGSRVVVAPESRLRVPVEYRAGGSALDVYLDHGDAFFVVKHDTSRPFLVHTTNGVVEDLGTEFLVSAHRRRGGRRSS